MKFTSAGSKLPTEVFLNTSSGCQAAALAVQKPRLERPRNSDEIDGTSSRDRIVVQLLLYACVRCGLSATSVSGDDDEQRDMLFPHHGRGGEIPWPILYPSL